MGKVDSHRQWRRRYQFSTEERVKLTPRNLLARWTSPVSERTMAIWPHPCPCGGGCWDIKPIVRLDPNEEQAQEPQRLRQPIFRGRVQSLQLGRRERHHESISGSERHEYFIVSVSTLPLAHLFVHPSPKGQQQEISGPGRESERRDRGSGEQKVENLARSYPPRNPQPSTFG